jgi:hypothetical protein
MRSTQVAPQRVGVAPPQPLVHANADPAPEQTGVPPLHTTPHAPQLVAEEMSVSQPFAGIESQSAKPGSQAYPQVVPLHVAELLVGRVHALQEVPQLETAAFETQAPAHRWKFALQAKPHAEPLHVGVAFGCEGHEVHDDPHEPTPVFETQAAPHR